ncbi:hypothetical protein KEM54_003238 [Ascosphaera aggregata]|nr:hypothetical protein KEM54_003238 [Ascosphaera aggregata]
MARVQGTPDCESVHVEIDSNDDNHASTSAACPRQHTGRRNSVTKTINLDSVVNLLSRSLFNPTFMTLILAGMLAARVPRKNPIFLAFVAYYSLLLLIPHLYKLNNTIAYGPARRFDAEQEVVVIAGGASGIGNSIAHQCIDRGLKVAILDIQKVPPNFTPQCGKDVRVYVCDATDLERLQQVANEISRDLGPPTILINSIATAINPHPLLQSTPQAIRKTIDANLITYFNTLKVFLPNLVSNPHGGHIITMSSVIGWLTAAGLTDYSATKAGMTAVHKALLAELRVSGALDKVKMVLIEMGQVATPLFGALDTPSQFFAPILAPEAVAEKIVQKIESGRGGLLRVPFYAQFVGIYAILPGAVQRLARWLSGIDLAVERSQRD